MDFYNTNTRPTQWGTLLAESFQANLSFSSMPNSQCTMLLRQEHKENRTQYIRGRKFFSWPELREPAAGGQMEQGGGIHVIPAMELIYSLYMLQCLEWWAKADMS